MTNESKIADRPDFLRRWGFWGMIAGALAMVLVFAHIAGPSLEPKPSVGSQIGEIAGEIRRSAWRSFLGLPKPPTEIKNPTIWDYMAFVAPFVGVLAIVLSVISRVLRENWRFAAYGTALGASAIVFHYFWWVAMLFAGVILLVAIIENIGDIFSFD
ncbi:MAG: hypothetical protein H6888_05270 [Nitratireductor sp.]|nr:hypothetical protein [Nitratireductor sp.]MCC0020468.1 hypothetical protein [Nitratireductor sp.]